MSNPELFHEARGTGQVIVLLHGLTAVGSQVIHGSRRLERAGYRTVIYDARGHGASGAPDPADPLQTAYSYDSLAADLGRIVELTVPPSEDFWLVGSSMGAHTVARFALDHPKRIAGVVIIGPAYTGRALSEEELAAWDRLSVGLRDGGVEGFVDAYSVGLETSDEWRERLIELARQRIALHRHPEAVADALEWVPRSTPFGGLEDLGSLEVPALVVGSDDGADPGHPCAVADAWHRAIPGSRLIQDDPGRTPTAWSGARLCDLIARFAVGHA